MNEKSKGGMGATALPHKGEVFEGATTTETVEQGNVANVVEDANELLEFCDGERYRASGVLLSDALRVSNDQLRFQLLVRVVMLSTEKVVALQNCIRRDIKRLSEAKNMKELTKSGLASCIFESLLDDVVLCRNVTRVQMRAYSELGEAEIAHNAGERYGQFVQECFYDNSKLLNKLAVTVKRKPIDWHEVTKL